MYAFLWFLIGWGSGILSLALVLEWARRHDPDA